MSNRALQQPLKIPKRDPKLNGNTTKHNLMRTTSKLFMVLAMLCGVACTTNTLEESVVENNAVSRELPNEINVSFDDATSRIQLDEQCRTTWTEDDEVSVFYFSDANNRFLFMGDTGDRNGALVVEDNRMSDATAEIDKVVLVYPYSDDYKLNATTKSIGITIPGTQYYLNGSYGVGANIMTSVGTTNDFALKSVCGWIKVQLTGAASVTEVTLTGNNKEQLAGDATLYYEENRLALLGEEGGPDDDSQVGGTLFFGEYVRTITLDCGEGIALDSTTPTEFYFVLAPQTFDEGITIKATLSDGTTITKSTSKSITIERNVITPMASFDVQPTNEIWYTSTDGNVVTPYATNVFGVNIVSNTYENGKGVIKFDGEVTEIGDYAFCNCSSLESITIPKKVTQLGARSFENSTSLTSIKISESVASIGEGAFAGCISLASFTIPDAITTVEPYTFCECYALAELTIGNSVTTIKGWAFCDCIGLTTVIIPDSVVSMEAGVFGGCSGLERFEGNNVSADGRCLIFDGMLKAFAPAGLTEYAIPEGVTAIEVYTFQKLENITTISIPRGIERISEGAFEFCPMLASFSTVNTDIKYIDKYAFQYCTGLTEVDVNSVEEIGGNDVFRGCTSLERVAINHVPDGLFSGCSSLKEVVICDGATSIGTGAFLGCTSLTSVTIGNGVTSIGDYAFMMCSSLASITIPDCVTSIGGGAFGRCTSLTSFYGKFASDDNRCLIIDGVLNSFATGCGLTEYAIPDSVTEIGNYTFNGCTSLTSVTISDSVTSIGDSAFNGCTSLTSVTIPDSVTSIGGSAFSGCTSLTSFYGKFASDDNRCLIIDGVLNSFATGCGLTEYAIPDSVTSIGGGAFNGCTLLTSVTIPEGVTSIGSGAFYGCESLTSVYCKPTTPPSGDWSMFEFNASGRKIYVPTESVEAYKTAEYWSNYAADIVGYSF